MKKGCLVIALLCVFMLVGFVGVGYFVLKATNTVQVQWTEADFTSFLKKGGMEFNDDYATVEEIIAGEFETRGSSQVNAFFSNEEISAALSKATRENSPLRNIRVRFRDDGKVEASGVINNNLDWLYTRYPEAQNYDRYLNLVGGRTVKILAAVENVDSKTFDVKVEKAYIGNIPLPAILANTYIEQLEAEINQVLEGLEDFHVEEFVFDSSGLNFVGTVPSEFKGIGLP